jgi:hypothetical protein
LGICASVGADWIEIETECDDGWTTARNLMQRLRIADTVRRYLLGDDMPRSLRFELRVEGDDRLIRVDGTERIFRGMRIAGDTRWSGSCQIDDCHVTVTTTGSATVDAIESTDANDLTDDPPRRPS